MSLVLVIIGLVVMIVFPALTLLRQSMQQQTTTSHLNSLMRASAAFVQANGCVPCPTPASTQSDGFGRVRGAIDGVACGGCPIKEGIVPFASLGVPMANAKDGWGHWITMRVDDDLTANLGLGPPTSLCTTDDPPCVLHESRKGLCSNTFPKDNGVRVLTAGGGEQRAAILFLSHGANGWGAYHADPDVSGGTDKHPAYTASPTPCSTTGGFERCNASNDAAKFFVSAPLSNNPSDPFDDQLIYLGRNALVTYLGNPACQGTDW